MKKLMHILGFASLGTVVSAFAYIAMDGNTDGIGPGQLLMMFGINMLVQTYFYEEK